MSLASRVPAVVADYFDGIGAGQYPVITQVFTPGVGWKRPGLRKRVTISWVRKLRAEGVTQVALSAGGRTADFGVAEIIRGGRR